LADYWLLFSQYTAAPAAYEVDFREWEYIQTYLTEEEYNQLASLDGKTIRKKRYAHSVQYHNFSIDVFEGRHQGLILAEMEFERQSELGGFGLPLFALKDVTDDPFFSGGNLVMMTDEEFRLGLSQRLRDQQSFSQNAA
jgi:CYTH domain-containing protein